MKFLIEMEEIACRDVLKECKETNSSVFKVMGGQQLVDFEASFNYNEIKKVGFSP